MNLCAGAVDPLELRASANPVRRRHYRNKIAFVESAAHAATATRWILKLAAAHHRVRRVYLYQWNATSSKQVWDSGLIGPRGDTRPAFNVLARAINVSRSVRTRP